MKKSIIGIFTVVVVGLGVFLGIKLMAKPNSSHLDNTAMLQDKKKEEKKTEEKGNFLSDSLKKDEKKEKDNKETTKDEKDNKNNLDKKDNKETITKDKDKENKKNEIDEKDMEKRGIKLPSNSLLEANSNLKSEQVSGNEVKIYDDQYVVKKGDNLFTIGRQFFVQENITDGIALIKSINKINENALIKVGDKLYIPTEDNFESKKQEAKGQKAYVVKSGDTLTSIAQKEMKWCDLQKGIKLLREINKLQNDNIQKDKKIYIPTEMPK